MPAATSSLECTSKKTTSGSKIKISKFKAHQPGKLNGQDHNLAPSLQLAPLTPKLGYTNAKGLTKEKDKNMNGHRSTAELSTKPSKTSNFYQISQMVYVWP